MFRKRRKVVNVQPVKSRAELEAQFGRAWDTAELAREFIVTAIIGSAVVVRRKSDDAVGTLNVKEGPPQFYYNFTPQPAEQ